MVERLASQWPYLVHKDPKAPHVTHCTKLIVQDGFRGGPSKWYTPSLRLVVWVLREVSRQAKICNLLESSNRFINLVFTSQHRHAYVIYEQIINICWYEHAHTHTHTYTHVHCYVPSIVINTRCSNTRWCSHVQVQTIINMHLCIEDVRTCSVSTLQCHSLSNKTFLAARSRWMKPFFER